MDIGIGSKDDYLVWIYEEADMLTNVLLSLAYFKRRFPGRWPREAVVHVLNRLTLTFGSCSRVRREEWTLRDAVYMSIYVPISDKQDGKRYPTRLPSKRQPVGKAFRDRAGY